MSIQNERRQAVGHAVSQIKSIIDRAPDVERLERSKKVLMDLCARSELFPEHDFPLPQDEAKDRTFLIYEDDEGSALYAITSVPGMSYRPHDHGGSWAIVAAVAGQERHRLFQRAAEDENKELGSEFRLIEKAQIICEPGCAVSLMPDGIHAIEGIGDEPMLHLHLYGTRFQDQKTRTEYDLETGRTESFVMDVFGFIEDKR